MGAGDDSDLNDALQVERDENDQRKSPTKSEMVALAEVIAEKLHGRHLANLKQNREGNISHSEDQGRSTDIAAAKAGLGSGKTLQAAQAVIANDATRNAMGMPKSGQTPPMCKNAQ